MIDREKVIRPLQAKLDEVKADGLDVMLCSTEIIEKVIALLKEQEAKVMNAQFAEMTFKNGNSMFLNTEYITSYGYLKDRDETAVSVLSEAKEIYFPGNQTAEIRSAFNRINEDRR